MRLSDSIEAFIKTLWDHEEAELELKRNELAEYFHCAPSQINYVLSTRFTPDHGYTTQSQRGGGGYIRIIRLQHKGIEYLQYLLRERIGDSIDYKYARNLCIQLAQQGTISEMDALLMASAMDPQALSVPIPESIKAVIRAKTLRSMLVSIAQRVQED